MTDQADYNDLAHSLAGVRRKNPYDHRRAFAQRLQAMGSDTSPIDHPMQGAARLAQALAGAYGTYRADADENAAVAKKSEEAKRISGISDPQERLAAYMAFDPQGGAKHSAALAMEQIKQGGLRQGLQDGAGGFGSIYGGGPQQSADVPPLAQGQTAPGAFANNLGNIRATPIGWEGKGPPQNGFETFNTPDHGAQAMVKNLGAYVQRNPNITVAQAIAQWAPPNENNTELYIRQLAESTGINPGMPLAEVLKDPVVAAQMLDAITRKEKGGLPQGVNADTFMRATGGNAQAPTPLTINMTQPQGIPPQGDTTGMPPAPNPGVVGGPTVQAAPQVPDVQRPQPTPQMLQQYQQRIASGEFGPDPKTAIPAARAALDAELDRNWGVQRERAKMQFGQQTTEYSEQRKVERENANPKFTEDANKAHAYALRVSKALPLLEQMVTSAEGPPSTLDRAVTNLPVVGNMLAGPRGEKFDQVSRDLVNAILRRESGATITDSEFKNAYRQYIPQVGEDPQTIQLKMENIRTQLKAFADTANRPPDVYGMQGNRGSTAAPQAVPAPATGAPQAGAVEGGYRFKGGNPADRNSWERVQ
ncbi:MAG: hypothetical protein Q8R02_23455 [Hyphomonadaceae bacterium]|nr:hypothetical protein [Hyphomonadaceae bacterium]